MNNPNSTFGWFYEMGNWLAKMMYLNVLWLLFTVMGLGLFGVTPATVALISVFHKWFEGESDISIFQHFKQVYKEEFMAANKLGLFMIAVGLFLFYDYYLSKEILQSFIVHVGLLILIVLYVLSFTYLLSVFVRYELKFFQYIKQALLIALARPLSSIGMIICVLVSYYILIIVPALSVFIGFSLFFYLISIVAYRSFMKIEEKKQTDEVS